MTTTINSKIKVGNGEKLLVIAGPCQIESREHALKTAEYLKKAFAKLPVNFVYKSSYDKANRTSLNGERGIGIQDGLQILQEVKNTLDIPVLTDIHNEDEAYLVADVVDVIQIPAFLCRQTDLLLAAGSTDKAINVKKGQFLHPSDMKFVAEKIASTGNEQIMLCERGTTFGYRELVVDMRGLEIMKSFGYPVIFDATHSVQSMGGANGSSGGAREYVAPLAKAAAAVGIDGVFLECHEAPEKAPSDGPNMLYLETVAPLVEKLCKIREVAC